MGEKYLIDSSAAIKYLNNSLPLSAILLLDSVFEQEINISIVSKVEMLLWNPPHPDDLIIVKMFIENAFIFPVNDVLGDISIEIRRHTNVKLPDVFIAATALANDFTLIADNDKDFNKIVALNIGLKYLNPFNIVKT